MRVPETITQVGSLISFKELTKEEIPFEIAIFNKACFILIFRMCRIAWMFVFTCLYKARFTALERSEYP